MKVIVIVGLWLSSDVFAGRFALFRSQQEFPYVQLAKRWADQGINIFTAVDKNGDSILHIAARTGNVVAARYWLDNGADINLLNSKKQSPIYVAIDNENSEVADLYLRKGAQFTNDVETANPVVIAARRGQTKILKKMLRAGADPNATDKANLEKTPLGVGYRSSITKLLLATKGIIVDKPDVNGNTPLHDAAIHGYIDRVERLIAAGANLNAVNKDGKTPADLAKENLPRFKQREWNREYEEVIELLLIPEELNFEPVP